VYSFSSPINSLAHHLSLRDKLEWVFSLGYESATFVGVFEMLKKVTTKANDTPKASWGG
jgi:hypothetical protein